MTIKKADITFHNYSSEVNVTFDNGTTDHLFNYYRDEIYFHPSEFIGLTVAQAHALKFRRDRAYLGGC